MQRAFPAAVATLVAACGNVSNPTFDAKPADAGAIDSAPPACDPSKPFGTPVEIKEIDTAANEWSAWLSVDRLTIYFARDQPCCNQLYSATRASVQDPFGTPTALTALNDQTAQTSNPTVTADGLTMYLHSENRTNSVGLWDIYTSTRPSTAAAWGTPALVAGVNTPDFDEDPYILPAGDTLYFDSNAPGTYDIYMATRNGSGSFGTVMAVTSVNTTAGQSSPVVTPDQLTLYFARYSGATPDIYVAHRSTIADGFGTATPVTELNTSGYDVPHWISDDGCTLLLASNGRVGSTGGMDIFLATRGK
jgi:hypothetical protein